MLTVHIHSRDFSPAYDGTTIVGALPVFLALKIFLNPESQR